MNAIELLKKDHQTVKSLFQSFEKAKEKEDLESKGSLFRTIKGELEAHTRVEEEIFYPAFDRTAGEADEDDKELVLEAGEEHLQVKTLLAELSNMEPDDKLFDAKMKVMKDNIDHHVEEEEEEMFPHAQKQLSSEELQQLGERMAARKDQIQEEGPDAPSPKRALSTRSQPARKPARKPASTARATTARRSTSSGSRTAKSSARPRARRSTSSRGR